MNFKNICQTSMILLAMLMMVTLDNTRVLSSSKKQLYSTPQVIVTSAQNVKPKILLEVLNTFATPETIKGIAWHQNKLIVAGESSFFTFDPVDDKWVNIFDSPIIVDDICSDGKLLWAVGRKHGLSLLKRGNSIWAVNLSDGKCTLKHDFPRKHPPVVGLAYANDKFWTGSTQLEAWEHPFEKPVQQNFRPFWYPAVAATNTILWIAFDPVVSNDGVPTGPRTEPAEIGAYDLELGRLIGVVATETQGLGLLTSLAHNGKNLWGTDGFRLHQLKVTFPAKFKNSFKQT